MVHVYGACCVYGLMCIQHTHAYRKEHMNVLTIKPYMHTWQYVGTSMVYLVCLSHDHTKVQVRTHGGTTWWVTLDTIPPNTLVLA